MKLALAGLAALRIAKQLSDAQRLGGLGDDFEGKPKHPCSYLSELLKRATMQERPPLAAALNQCQKDHPHWVARGQRKLFV